MYSPNPATDQLVYAARRLLGVAEWLAEGAADHGHADGCCSDALDALSSATLDMPRLLSTFTHYSDGRPMVSTISIDDDNCRVSHLWPPDPADHPTEPVESPTYSLAPDVEPGDRGSAVVTWDPMTFTGAVRYIAPPRPRNGLAVVR